MSLQFCWASKDDQAQTVELIQRYKRQSMNLRVMDDARLFICKNQNQIVGWIGISTHYIENYAEYFSLFVFPNFRGRGIGLALEYEVLAEAKRCGHEVLHFRFEGLGEPKLRERREKSPSIEYFTPSEDLRSLCRHCELFSNECREQRYMKIRVEGRMKELAAELKKYKLDNIPL